MKSIAVLVVLSTLTLLLNSSTGPVATQVLYAIELQGLTWNHTVLRVLVIPQNSESWWKPVYLNATLRAVSQWNNAILDFSASNASFSYLSKIRLFPSVGDSMESGYDVYVSWTEVYRGTDTIGSSEATWVPPCTIIRDVVYLGARVSEGPVLNEADMQNVALHELGHVLGLGHSNYEQDVMAARYLLGSRVRALSNLDLYGLAEVFEWASRLVIPGVSRICPRVSHVSLQPGEEYACLAISSSDLPPQTHWETPVDTLQAFFLTYVPLPGVIIVVVGITLIVIGVRRELRRLGGAPEDIPRP